MFFTFLCSNNFLVQNDFEFEINESPILDNWINLSDIYPNYSNPVYKPELDRVIQESFERIYRLPAKCIETLWLTMVKFHQQEKRIFHKHDQLKSQPTFLLEDLSI